MKHRLLVLAAVMVLCAAGASADTLKVLAGDSALHPWQTPSTASTPQNPVPGALFWNNWSLDGKNADCNIGYWLSGTGGCSVKDSVDKTPFYANSPGVTAPSLGSGSTTFGFEKTDPSAQMEVTLHTQVSMYGAAGQNEFGWFNTSDPNVLNPLFQGVTSRGTTFGFIPSGVYGFYLKSPTGLYRTTDVDGTGRSHFALFQLQGQDHYLFGMEDMVLGMTPTDADFDYNDVMIELRAVSEVPVPEPASMLLVGTGLLGLAARVRRARKNR